VHLAAREVDDMNMAAQLSVDHPSGEGGL